MNCVNLIPIPRRLAAARRRRVRRWLVTWLAFGLLILLGCELSHVVWGGERKTLDEGINATARQIRESSRRIQTLCRRLGQTQWHLESCRAIGRQPDWSVPLAMLARELGEDVVLERCKLQPAKLEAGGWSAREPDHADEPDAVSGDVRFVLSVNGLGRSQAAVSQYVLRLEKSGLFDRVRLIKTHREPFLGGRAVVFQLECLLEGKAGSP